MSPRPRYHGGSRGGQGDPARWRGRYTIAYAAALSFADGEGVFRTSALGELAVTQSVAADRDYGSQSAVSLASQRIAAELAVKVTLSHTVYRESLFGGREGTEDGIQESLLRHSLDMVVPESAGLLAPVVTWEVVEPGYQSNPTVELAWHPAELSTEYRLYYVRRVWISGGVDQIHLKLLGGFTDTSATVTIYETVSTGVESRDAIWIYLLAWSDSAAANVASFRTIFGGAPGS